MCRGRSLAFGLSRCPVSLPLVSRLMLPRKRIGPWRTTLQWLVTLAILWTPFIELHGESALRLDLPSRSLILLGRVHPVEQMHLLLLLSLSLVLLFLLATVVLGRVWCGFACPQTTLSDVAEALRNRLGLHRRGRARSAAGVRIAALHVLYLALAVLVGANLVWYFVPPSEFLRLVLARNLPTPALTAWTVVAAAVYLDLAVVGRSFCSSFCPYGRFQAALADPATLTLQQLPGQTSRCLECGACTRACPTGIDIRQRQQIECINCGRCRDACVEVMGRRGEPGLIGYAFGHGGLSGRSLVNLRTGLLVLAAAGALAAFAVAAARWQPVSLALRHSAAPDRTLPDGRSVAFFTASIQNRGQDTPLLDLTASLGQGPALEVKGRTTGISVPPRAGVQVDLAVILPREATSGTAEVVFRLADAGGRTVAAARASVKHRPPEGR